MSKTRPDDARRFLQAYLEGIKISRTDAEYTKQIIGKYTKTTDVADLENSYQTFLAGMGTITVGPGRGRADDA